jgi:hypothetical protein
VEYKKQLLMERKIRKKSSANDTSSIRLKKRRVALDQTTDDIEHSILLTEFESEEISGNSLAVSEDKPSTEQVAHESGDI